MEKSQTGTVTGGSKLEKLWRQQLEGQVPSSIMRKFVYKSGRTQSAQGRETCP